MLAHVKNVLDVEVQWGTLALVPVSATVWHVNTYVCDVNMET